MLKRGFIINMICCITFLQTIGQTERITFQAPHLYPEGTVFYSKKNTFFVSSVKTGTIGKVDSKGNYTIFYEDSGLKSTFGMKIDEKKNRLWVLASDPNKLYSNYSDSSTLKKMIRLIGINLNTGKKEADIDLSNLYQGKHFGNDLTIGNNGNIYITDSYSPVIYKVDLNGKPSVFATSDLFKAEDLGLNGIVYNPAGYLLTANSTNGCLLKVDIKDPSKITKVKLSMFIPGADGLLMNGNDLIISQNKGVNKALDLMSNDNWMSAQLKGATSVEDRFAQPSTLTMMNGKVFLLNSKLNELQDSTIPKSKEFSLQVAQFRPMH